MLSVLVSPAWIIAVEAGAEAEAGKVYESWGQKQLEDFVTRNVMRSFHKTQITAWGTWNADVDGMTIFAEDLGKGNVHYRIVLPPTLVDTYLSIGGASIWTGDAELKKTATNVSFQRKVIDGKIEPLEFTMPSKHQNKSFLTIEGWKNGKQVHCRIWLCGFTGLTGIAKLKKRDAPLGRM